MSLLPQRKKSAEEIAKLRETLGIPGQAVVEDEAPTTAPASAIVSRPIPEIPKPEPAAKAPAPNPKPSPPLPDTPEPEPEKPVVLPSTDSASPPVLSSRGVREVRSLKRSERVPVLPTGEPEPVRITPIAPEPLPHSGKVVHSLRKSELVPITPADIHTPPADSKLPVHRHSDRELNELRRQAAITQQGVTPAFVGMAAHPALIIPGYLLIITAAACMLYYELSINVTGGCIATALLIAVFIYLRKPLSRHHAAFISVMSLFVIVFGALHYFPQLRYGT